MNSDRRRDTKIEMLKAQDNLSFHPALEASDSRQSLSPGYKPSLESAVIKSSKKRYRSLEEKEDPVANAKIAKLQEPGIDAPRDLKARKESPWGSYTEVLNLNLNGPITVAERKSPHSGLVAIKVFPSTAAEKALYRHQHIKHDKIVTVLDAFTTETSLYIVLEHLPISLRQVVEGAKYPTERQLAAMVQQILRGLVYLESERLEHGSLNCSNILLSTQGNIKIANQQCCETVREDGEPRDVRALSPIMMELMQKYVKDDGAIGVDNLHRWPSDCDAVTFLSDTTSAASARELQDHALIRRRTQKECLMGLIFSAEVSARRDYSCSA
ncbi:kinase-like domain-containing protein [Halenospora varia]|nr:kinase-like domain-containing protein [Halenospora varia]